MSLVKPINIAAARAAATAVLNALQEITVWNDDKIIVVGDLALWRHLRSRASDDIKVVYLILDTDDTLDSIHERLMALRDPSFLMLPLKGSLVYKDQRDSSKAIVSIRIWKKQQDMPSCSMKIRDVPRGFIPFVCRIDLLVHTAEALGQGVPQETRHMNAAYAEEIVYTYSISPSDAQKDRVRGQIRDLVKYGSKDEAWWRLQLRID